MFLNSIQPQTLLQRQFIATLQQSRITLVYHLAIDGHAHCLFFFIYIIVGHRKEPFSLQREDFLDTTPYSIYHIEVNHSLAETLIAEMTLWPLMFKSLLDSARNKITTIAIIQFTLNLSNQITLKYALIFYTSSTFSGIESTISGIESTFSG